VVGSGLPTTEPGAERNGSPKEEVAKVARCSLGARGPWTLRLAYGPVHAPVAQLDRAFAS
jgi:hypothetical protein